MFPLPRRTYRFRVPYGADEARARISRLLRPMKVKGHVVPRQEYVGIIDGELFELRWISDGEVPGVGASVRGRIISRKKGTEIRVTVAMTRGGVLLLLALVPLLVLMLPIEHRPSWLTPVGVIGGLLLGWMLRPRVVDLEAKRTLGHLANVLGGNGKKMEG